jgi:hypothetical protein
MRSPWYLAVAVWIGVLLGVGLHGAVRAESKLLRAAQAENSTDELPDIVAGPQNPLQTLVLEDGIADLSALQVTVTAPQTRNITIDTVTIGFGIPFGEETTTGNESFLDELRARLIIEDVQVNGLQDPGEVTEGTQFIEDLEDPATVFFGLSPPLALAAGTSATFLVVVDINQPEDQSTAMPTSRHAAAWILMPLIALVAYGAWSMPRSRLLCFATLVLFICGVLLTGCSNDDDDELRFVVNLPSNGLISAGQRLGPENAIAGTTVRLMR